MGGKSGEQKDSDFSGGDAKEDKVWSFPCFQCRLLIRIALVHWLVVRLQEGRAPSAVAQLETYKLYWEWEERSQVRPDRPCRVQSAHPRKLNPSWCVFACRCPSWSLCATRTKPLPRTPPRRRTVLQSFLRLLAFGRRLSLLQLNSCHCDMYCAAIEVEREQFKANRINVSLAVLCAVLAELNGDLRFPSLLPC